MKNIQCMATAIVVLALSQQTFALNEADGIDSWGLGFGLGVEQYRTDYINEARLQGPNRIVTTEQTYQTLPSAWLTTNWNVVNIFNKETAFGFFVGVKLIDANAEAFSSFALGPQVSFVGGERTISVGLGWVTHGTKEYASGIVEGQPLPSQYDDIVFHKGTENSGMLMVSIDI